MPSNATAWPDWALPWLSAWRGLPDNPLHSYMQLGLKRRAARQSALSRWLGPLVALGLTICIALLGVLYDSTSPEDLFTGIWFVATSLLYLFWLYSGLWTMVRESLALLSRPGRRDVSLQIDDMLCLSSLTDHEILVAGIANVWSLLLPRIVIGALLFTADLGVSKLISSNWDESIFTIFLLSPVTIISLSACGMLAVAVLSLTLVAAGRSLKVDRIAAPATMLILLTSISWPVLAVQLYEGAGSSSDYFVTYIAQFLGGTAAILLVLAVALIAEFRVWLRIFWAYASSLLLPALFTSFFILMSAWSMIGDAYGYTPAWEYWSDEAFGHFFFSYVRAWGSYTLLNPMAIPTQLCLGETYSYEPPLWPNLIATLLLQLTLIGVLAHFALRAVRMRRLGE